MRRAAYHVFVCNREKKNKNEYKHDKKVIPIRSEVLQLMLTDNKNDLDHFDT